MIMRKNLSFIIYTLLFIGLLDTPVFSQLSQSNKEVQAQLLLIEDLIENNRFLAAQNLILECKSSEINMLQETELAFLNVLVSLKMDLREGPGLVEKFEDSHPEFSRLESLKKAKGDYYFKHKKYKNSAIEYEQVRPNNLDKDERITFFFKIGYSYFMTDKPKKAKNYFYKVKDSNSSYAASATYYYSHINYEDKNYPSALKGFFKLENDAVFKSIVPYYISQIYYQEENYEKLLETAPRLFKEAKGARKNEIAKLIGDANFKLKNYKESIEYLKYYKENARSGYQKSDYYQLAFAYMEIENYTKAIKYFEKVRNKENALSQNALYNLGNCYLKTDQKEFAGKTFYASYQMDFDVVIKEDAMFNFAKISYELSNDPFNRAITAINNYIDTYPNSPRKNEAYAYLVNLFLSSKNYKGALVAIENIPNRSSDLNNAYQKIAFNRALELYDENRFSEASEIFQKSLTFPTDQILSLKAKYWLADCKYQQHKYYDAIKLWKELASDYSVNKIEEHQQINYNLAFSYYMLKNYAESITWFKKVVTKSENNPKITADAYLRTGDCYYILKDFKHAINYYGLAFDMNQRNADYAMYQRALAHGGNGNLDRKATELSTFYNKFPKSPLADDALFELGTTYLIFEKSQSAINSFSNLVQNYPDSPFKRQAMLKIGLTHYNMDENEKALKVLKQVVHNYSGTKESKEALVSIRNIYVESNAAEDFFVYVKNIPFINISNNEQDSITYMATENVYMNGNCDAALPGFNNYLSQYPQGAFSINAHFYRAECLMKTNRFDEAANDYQFVLENSEAAFRETSLLKTARIYRFNKDYQKALRNYQELFSLASSEVYLSESLDGQLECYQQMQMNDSVLVMAKTILSSRLVSEQTIKKAHAYMAHAALVVGDLNLANQEYTIVSKLVKGSTAAEAKYYQALIQYKLEDYKESEKIVFELINEYGSYDQWITKGFILLADIYVKYGNTFQAKQTLQSIIEHQEDTVLVNIAKKKKKVIEELEAIEEQVIEGPQETDSIVLESELR
ncbi:MAG: tetratricopeptide repeat protein [Bacteroidales bacterium]|nr:tetratricopeptide repeat protein [Bacteroidales bacterium]